MARLPFDLVERVAAGDREEPLRSDARRAVGHGVDVVLGLQWVRLVPLVLPWWLPFLPPGRP